jgi:hypothetical protein
MVLISQKSITELAQTSDVLPTNTDALTSQGATLGSIKTQQLLFKAQTDTYARSAEQKIMAMMLDNLNVSMTAGNTIANESNRMNNTVIGAVVVKALAGIEVSVPDPVSE